MSPWHEGEGGTFQVWHVTWGEGGYISRACHGVMLFWAGSFLELAKPPPPKKKCSFVWYFGDLFLVHFIHVKLVYIFGARSAPKISPILGFWEIFSLVWEHVTHLFQGGFPKYVLFRKTRRAKRAAAQKMVVFRENLTSQKIYFLSQIYVYFERSKHVTFWCWKWTKKWPVTK